MLVSLVVTVVAGALLTRRSLEESAARRPRAAGGADRRPARERSRTRTAETTLGRFLATDAAAARDPHARAGRAAAPRRVRRAPAPAGRPASGSVDVRGERVPLRGAPEAATRRSCCSARPTSQAADWWPFALGLGLAGLVGAALAAVVALLLAAGRRAPDRARVGGERRARRGRAARAAAGRRARARSRRSRASFNDLSDELDTDAGRRARLPALRQPRAEDAADRDPRPRRGARRRRARARRRRCRDRARGAAARAPRRRPARPRRGCAAARSRSRPSRRPRRRRGARRSSGTRRPPGRSASRSTCSRSRTRSRSAIRTACSRRSRTSSRTRCARRRAAARCASSPAPGRLEVVDDGPGHRRGRSRRTRSSASTSTTGRATAAASERASGSRSCASSREAMDGAVSVRSELGVGSTFTISLPAFRRAPASRSPAARHADRAPPRFVPRRTLGDTSASRRRDYSRAPMRVAAGDGDGLGAPLQAGVAQPVLPLDPDLHAADLRDDGVLPLPRRHGRADARRGRRRHRDDGDLVADDDRRGRGAPVSPAHRDARAARRRAASRSGPSSRRSRSRSRRSASTRSSRACSTRGLLFGVSLGDRRTGPRSSSPCPSSILAIGMLGFMLGGAFVRFRAAWAVGNLFEFPVWTICGLLIPIAVLPAWVEPVVVGVRADLGHERAPRRRARRRVAVGRHRDVRSRSRSSTARSARSCSASSSAPRVAAATLALT